MTAERVVAFGKTARAAAPGQSQRFAGNLPSIKMYQGCGAAWFDSAQTPGVSGPGCHHVMHMTGSRRSNAIVLKMRPLARPRGTGARVYAQDLSKR